MHPFRAKGNDALLVEEQLAHGAIGGGVRLERRVSLEIGAVKGGDSALNRYRQNRVLCIMERPSYIFICSP